VDTHHLLKDDQVMRNTVRIEGPEIIVIDNNKKDKHYCACISHKCGLAVWMYESVRSESMSGSPYLQYHLHRYNKQLLSTSKYYSWFHMVSWKNHELATHIHQPVGSGRVISTSPECQPWRCSENAWGGEVPAAAQSGPWKNFRNLFDDMDMFLIWRLPPNMNISGH